jgi:hypothetical protein
MLVGYYSAAAHCVYCCVRVPVILIYEVVGDLE